MIRVLKPGMLTTVQDTGRCGYTHLGVSPAGAADRISLRVANLLVGNAENAAALECTLLGPILQFDSRAQIAITGSSTSTDLPFNECFEVFPGQRVEIGNLESGARAYIAVRGGIEVPMLMQSASTLLPASLGGHLGRALRASDTLHIGHQTAGPPRKLRDRTTFEPGTGPIRVTETIQTDWFSADTRDKFRTVSFMVSEHSNRSGIRLEGPAILAHRRSELITEGISLGAIQVPSDGQPIILFVDQQTTGGYPKIANVATVDLPRVAQLRPRDRVMFNFISFTEAVQLLSIQERTLREAFA